MITIIVNGQSRIVSAQEAEQLIKKGEAVKAVKAKPQPNENKLFDPLNENKDVRPKRHNAKRNRADNS